jgi:hypothetical protein
MKTLYAYAAVDDFTFVKTNCKLISLFKPSMSTLLKKIYSHLLLEYEV